MVLLKSCCRLRLVAIYQRDPCGIRAGSNGIRRDPWSAVLLKSCSRLRLVAIYGRDPCGILAGSNGIRGNPDYLLRAAAPDLVLFSNSGAELAPV